MTHNIDIKRLGIDELYKRAQQIDQNITIEHSKGGSANYDVVQQLRSLKQEIIEELKERQYNSIIDKPLKGNLTNDSLAQQEQQKQQDDRFKK